MSIVTDNFNKSQEKNNDAKKIKLVIWDLDNTIWKGILAEDKKVSLVEGIVDIIRTLDERGILQSVVSKNNYNEAMAQLEAFNIDKYFIYPQIGWDRKSVYIKEIIRLINIGEDTVMFIDDQPFERDEVKFSLPNVSCLDVVNIPDMLSMPSLNPLFITSDAKNRRQLYQNDIVRNEVKEQFNGTEEEFLKHLGMKFTISNATEEDLQRAEELTVRTHQLNSTGYTYSYDELKDFIKSDNHILLIAELEDKYGSYGKIGLSLVECCENFWTLKLLLMSCRVVSRGVGTILLCHIMNMAKKKSKKLRAEFVCTDRNRMMYLTYKLAGFKEKKIDNGITILENDLTYIQPYPEYLVLCFNDEIKYQSSKGDEYIGKKA